MDEVEYRSRGNLTEEEQEQFDRYIRKRIESIRRKDPAAYRNFIPLTEIEKAVRECREAPASGI